MADDKNKKEEAGKGDEAAKADATAPAGKSKKMLFIGLGIVGLLVLIGVPVAIFAFKGGEKAVDDLAADAAHGEGSTGHAIAEGSLDEDELEDGEEGFGAFFPMETFVVNLTGGRFIRCQIQLEFVEREVPKRFYARMIPARDEVLAMLTRKTQDELLTDKGKENLKKSIKDSINELLKKEEVKRVYFTQFVIQ